MKTFITVLFICLTSAFAAIAQETKQAPATTQYDSRVFGIKAGVNFSTLSDIDGAGFVPGFHAGLTAGSRKTEYFGFGAELYVSMQGAKTRPEISLLYINLPVFMNVHAGKVALQYGAYGGLLLAANAGSGGGSDISGLFEPFDLGGLVGLTVSPAGRIYFNARANLGIADIITYNSWQNRSIQVGLGYNFK